ncbi:methyltransferase type 11 [Brevundimonas guildfordensis]|uniref:Methyltransferase type 11 n=1 Tax=Brevundimonas guildfordensis TaxID=2762241 RepID=A0ABR8QZB7_9CAUL|nr:methyltransferase type 11 [Brevundimonas guildfordensis]MBD7940868.1 methyltransferase type 11 [Brevundimonas guildfordensis]
MQHMTWPVIALTLMAAACDNPSTVRITTSSTSDSSGVLKVVDALQCPQTQGVLTRKGSARADGSCLYGGPRGSEVILQLVQLNGRSSAEALKLFENRLTSDLPEAMAQVEAENARVEAEAAKADADAARADADASRAAAEAEVEAAAGDSAQVRMPGLRVDAQGDKATVRLPGMRIDADGDRANIRIGGLTIRADDKSSRVNVSSANDAVKIDAADGAARVRTSGSGEAVRATFLMTGKEASASGWRTVGYEARGPVGGPVVVATVRSKDRDPDRLFDAAKALVTLNVGD